MARNQEPMTDEAFDELAANLEELRAETREALAEELGGDPENYRVDEKPVPEGRVISLFQQATLSTDGFTVIKPRFITVRQRHPNWLTGYLVRWLAV